MEIASVTSRTLASFSPRQIALLAFATVAPRVVLAIFLGVVGEPERWEYDVIAANIASGEGHVYNRTHFLYAAYSPPVWSYTLAALLHLPGSTRVAIQILQALFCFGAAVVFGGLARRLTENDGTGLMAGLLVALQPSLLYYSVVKSDPLPMSVFLLGLILASMGELTRTASLRPALSLGVLTGLGLLARGVPVAALPVALLALLARWKHKTLKPSLAVLFTFGVCVAPWLLRNLVMIGAPVITSTASENFWRGNHLGASGGVRDLDGAEITSLTPSLVFPEAIRGVLTHGTEKERHEVFAAEAWGFIGAHPAEALRLYARKMATFWWRIESNQADYPATAMIGYELLYRGELALALLGAWGLLVRRSPGRSRAARDLTLLALALMIAISLLQSAFYVQGRHRFLIEPILLMFSAAGAMAVIQRWATTAKRSDRQAPS